MRTTWLDRLLLVTLVVPTWEKLFWQTSLVTLTLTNLLAMAFVVAFLVERARRRDQAVPAASIALAGFMLAFAAVYLAGYFDLRDKQAESYWAKGMGAWGVHFAFLVCGCAHVVRRGRGLYLKAMWAFVAGMALNCAYGVVQLGLQVAAGINLDTIVVGGLTGGQGKQGGINVFGAVDGQSVYRINALTGDPNHLGVFLCVPVLVLLPWYLNDRRGRRKAGLLLLFVAVVQGLTLSRSAALGDIVGLAVLLPALRGHLPRMRTLGLGFGAVAAAALAAYGSSHYIRTVIDARTSTSGSGTATHLQFYQLVPPALDPSPLFGMGFNTFAVFYQFITGRTDFGPHSSWVATLVETGMAGFTLYLGYFLWLVANAGRMRRAADEDMSRIGWGLLAALAGTAAANFFYLTMTLEYFFAVALLVVAGAALFAPVGARRPRVASVQSTA